MALQAIQYILNSSILLLAQALLSEPLTAKTHTFAKILTTARFCARRRAPYQQTVLQYILWHLVTINLTHLLSTPFQGFQVATIVAFYSFSLCIPVTCSTLLLMTVTAFEFFCMPPVSFRYPLKLRTKLLLQPSPRCPNWKLECKRHCQTCQKEDSL